MDKGRAVWPAGSETLAKVHPSVTVSISLQDNKTAKRCGFAKIDVDSRRKETRQGRPKEEKTKKKKELVEKERA